MLQTKSLVSQEEWSSSSCHGGRSKQKNTGGDRIITRRRGGAAERAAVGRWLDGGARGHGQMDERMRRGAGGSGSQEGEE